MLHAAETLLVDPALFCPQRALCGQAAPGPLDGARLLLEYFDAAEEHGPTPFRMVKGHTFKLLGEGQAGLWGWGRGAPQVPAPSQQARRLLAAAARPALEVPRCRRP
jgi:hypothetical protein